MGYVYKITNDINEKVYIGKTNSSIQERFKEHCTDSTKRRCEKRPLYNAMNKYGIDKFHIELVEECDDEILSNREIYWIEYYHSYSNGYNATFGGEGKPIYDYDYIIKLYNQGLCGKDIAKELGCDASVISSALRQANIDTKKNINDSLSNPIKAIFKDGSTKEFTSIANAARWLKENNYTKAKDLNGIIANISRVAKGKDGRKSYLKIKWSFIK